MESLGASPKMWAYVIVSLVAALTAATTAAVASSSKPNAARAVGFAFAALLGPMVAIFAGARLIIGGFRDLALGGGVGTTAAILSEAYRPLFFAATAGCIIALSGLLLFLAQPTKEAESGIQAAAMILIALLLSRLPAVALSRVDETVMRVIDPNASAIQQTPAGLGEVAEGLARDLVRAAYGSVAVGLALLFGAMVIPARMKANAARPIVAVALLLVIFATGYVAVRAHARSSALRQIAITGHIP
jgi:hypothetical protein